VVDSSGENSGKGRGAKPVRAVVGFVRLPEGGGGLAGRPTTLGSFCRTRVGPSRQGLDMNRDTRNTPGGITALGSFARRDRPLDRPGRPGANAREVWAVCADQGVWFAGKTGAGRLPGDRRRLFADEGIG